MRTQEEIVERMKAVAGDDMFGFSQSVLLDALDYEHAKPHLKEDVTPEQWAEREHGVYGGKEQVGPLLAEDRLKQAALDYLKFAWGKADDHRGISAGRSVQKLTEYCWLLGHDVKVIEEADYPMYGCPQLKVISGLLGADLPTEPALVRMMEGSPCSEGCSGCSS